MSKSPFKTRSSNRDNEAAAIAATPSQHSTSYSQRPSTVTTPIKPSNSSFSTTSNLLPPSSSKLSSRQQNGSFIQLPSHKLQLATSAAASIPSTNTASTPSQRKTTDSLGLGNFRPSMSSTISQQAHTSSNTVTQSLIFTDSVIDHPSSLADHMAQQQQKKVAQYSEMIRSTSVLQRNGSKLERQVSSLTPNIHNKTGGGCNQTINHHPSSSSSSSLRQRGGGGTVGIGIGGGLPNIASDLHSIAASDENNNNNNNNNVNYSQQPSDINFHSLEVPDNSMATPVSCLFREIELPLIINPLSEDPFHNTRQFLNFLNNTHALSEELLAQANSSALKLQDRLRQNDDISPSSGRQSHLHHYQQQQPQQQQQQQFGMLESQILRQSMTDYAQANQTRLDHEAARLNAIKYKNGGKFVNKEDKLAFKQWEHDTKQMNKRLHELKKNITLVEKQEKKASLAANTSSTKTHTSSTKDVHATPHNSGLMSSIRHHFGRHKDTTSSKPSPTTPRRSRQLASPAANSIGRTSNSRRSTGITNASPRLRSTLAAQSPQLRQSLNRSISQFNALGGSRISMNISTNTMTFNSNNNNTLLATPQRPTSSILETSTTKGLTTPASLRSSGVMSPGPVPESANGVFQTPGGFREELQNQIDSKLASPGFRAQLDNPNTKTYSPGITAVAQKFSWINLNSVLNNSLTCHYFYLMLKREMSLENLTFWKDVNLLFSFYRDICYLRSKELREAGGSMHKHNNTDNTSASATTRLSLPLFYLTQYFYCGAALMFEEYVSYQGSTQVNLPDKLAHSLEKAICEFAEANDLINEKIIPLREGLAHRMNDPEQKCRLVEDYLSSKLHDVTSPSLSFEQQEQYQNENARLMNLLSEFRTVIARQHTDPETDIEQLQDTHALLIENEAIVDIAFENVIINFDVEQGQYIEVIMECYLHAASEIQSLINRDTFSRFKKDTLWTTMICHCFIQQQHSILFPDTIAQRASTLSPMLHQSSFFKSVLQRRHDEQKLQHLKHLHRVPIGPATTNQKVIQVFTGNSSSGLPILQPFSPTTTTTTTTTTVQLPVNALPMTTKHSTIHTQGPAQYQQQSFLRPSAHQRNGGATTTAIPSSSSIAGVQCVAAPSPYLSTLTTTTTTTPLNTDGNGSGGITPSSTTSKPKFVIIHRRAATSGCPTPLATTTNLNLSELSHISSHSPPSSPIHTPVSTIGRLPSHLELPCISSQPYSHLSHDLDSPMVTPTAAVGHPSTVTPQLSSTHHHHNSQLDSSNMTATVTTTTTTTPQKPSVNGPALQFKSPFLSIVSEQATLTEIAPSVVSQSSHVPFSVTSGTNIAPAVLGLPHHLPCSLFESEHNRLLSPRFQATELLSPTHRSILSPRHKAEVLALQRSPSVLEGLGSPKMALEFAAAAALASSVTKKPSASKRLGKKKTRYSFGQSTPSPRRPTQQQQQQPPASVVPLLSPSIAALREQSSGNAFPSSAVILPSQVPHSPFITDMPVYSPNRRLLQRLASTVEQVSEPRPPTPTLTKKPSAVAAMSLHPLFDSNNFGDMNVPTPLECYLTPYACESESSSKKEHNSQQSDIPYLTPCGENQQLGYINDSNNNNNDDDDDNDANSNFDILSPHHGTHNPKSFTSPAPKSTMTSKTTSATKSTRNRLSMAPLAEDSTSQIMQEFAQAEAAAKSLAATTTAPRTAPNSAQKPPREKISLSTAAAGGMNRFPTMPSLITPCNRHQTGDISTYSTLQYRQFHPKFTSQHTEEHSSDEDEIATLTVVAETPTSFAATYSAATSKQSTVRRGAITSKQQRSPINKLRLDSCSSVSEISSCDSGSTTSHYTSRPERRHKKSSKPLPTPQDGFEPLTSHFGGVEIAPIKPDVVNKNEQEVDNVDQPEEERVGEVYLNMKRRMQRRMSLFASTTTRNSAGTLTAPVSMHGGVVGEHHQHHHHHQDVHDTHEQTKSLALMSSPGTTAMTSQTQPLSVKMIKPTGLTIAVMENSSSSSLVNNSSSFLNHNSSGLSSQASFLIAAPHDFDVSDSQLGQSGQHHHHRQHAQMNNSSGTNTSGNAAARVLTNQVSLNGFLRGDLLLTSPRAGFAHTTNNTNEEQGLNRQSIWKTYRNAQQQIHNFTLNNNPTTTTTNNNNNNDQ